MSFILGPAILIFVIVFIVAAVFVIRKDSSDHKSMNELLRNTYTYLVCFATLMMSIGGGVGIFMAGADAIAPTGYYMSYVEYKNSLSNVYHNGEKQNVEYTEAEMRTLYSEYKSAEMARTRNQAMNSLVKALGWIVVPLPIFILYTRRLRKSE